MNRRDFIQRCGGFGVLLAVAGRAEGDAGAPDGGALLRQALRERRVATFTYHGHARRVEPHALGALADGRRALLAYQVSGDSSSEPPPGWRTFVLAEIVEPALTTSRFNGPRPDYRQGDPGLASVEVEVAAGR